MAREMKDSGVKWIGEIPEDWVILSPRYWASQRDAGNWGSDENEDENNIICIRIADFDYNRLCIKKGYEYTLRNYPKYIIKKLSLQKGDLLIEKSGGGEKTPVGRIVMYDLDEPALFANFSERIRIDKAYCSKYTLYAFVAHYGLGLSRLYFNQTTGIQNLIMSEFMREVKLPLPPLSEQKAIADYLDEKCGEIDGLLEDLAAEVKTLTEYKKSIIAETVTHGLNPNAPMKDSGIPWADTIPAHWNIEKGKYHFELRKTKGNPHNLELMSPSQKYGVIPQSQLDGVVLVKEKTDLNTFRTICPGDFCISLRSFQGGFEYSNYEGVVSPAYQVFYPIKPIADSYYKYIFKSDGFITYINTFSMSLRDGKNIAFEDFGNSYIPTPPIEEQKAIAAFLDEKCATIDQSIADKNTQIETLKAYKSSLIYEYVTGKKQVI